MSDLFEDDTEDADVEVGEEFSEVDDELLDVESGGDSIDHRDLDARRRLENMLDERRLRDELDDFVDY